MRAVSSQLRFTVYSALFAAMIGVGAFIVIPVGPVPIVLQNLMVLLAGLLLGRKWGAGSVAVYLLAGAVGLPVFSAGRGGVGHIVGPTGGYLLSYLPAAYITGGISEIARGRRGYWGRERVIWDSLAALCGSVVIYIGGVPWLRMVTGLSWEKSLMVGVYPFVIGDIVKIATAVFIAAKLRPYLSLELNREMETDDGH